MRDRLVEQLQRLLVPSEEGVMLCEEVERPDVRRRVGPGWARVGRRVREGGEDGGGGQLDDRALLGRAVEGLEVCEEGGDTLLETCAKEGLEQPLELVTYIPSVHVGKSIQRPDIPSAMSSASRRGADAFENCSEKSCRICEALLRFSSVTASAAL